MAHIERRESGRWRARYRTPDGRERSKTFARRVDAQRFLAGVETDKSRGEWVDPRLGRTRFDDFAGRWLAAVAPTLKPKTVATYESLLRSRIQPAFGAWPLASLMPSDVQAWVGDMLEEGLSPSRIRQANVVLSLVLQAAVRDGVVARNVANGVRLPKLAREEAPYFDPATVDRIVAAMPEPYDLLVRILGTLGPRWGEAAALRRSSVDLLRRRLRIVGSTTEVGGRLVYGQTKSYSVRQVPLTPALLAQLGTHLAGVAPEPDAPLFVSPSGGPLRHGNFYHRLWRPTLRILGLPAVGLHVLRHSAAARMIGAGASPKAVQVVLGHCSAAFTLTVYGHIFDADLDDLAARLDGDMGTALRILAASPRPGAPDGELFTGSGEKKSASGLG
ncbi:MAG: tyrosine-type recombinase/integrase [Acidimicrobiia bacterium]